MNPTAPLSPEDFQLLFESAPGLYLVLTTDFEIVGASDAYLRATKTQREMVVGRGLFEVFPDNPADQAATGVGNLRASLERVRKQLQPDTMPVQKYDIRRPEEEGGGFEERHWSPTNSPVLDANGKLRFLLHRVEDVTDFVRLKDHETAQSRQNADLQTRAGRLEFELFQRAQELHEANKQLRAFHAELEARVESRTQELARAGEALRKSEEHLRQAQKLEAIGRLAGGIAHDFNNLLSVVLSYSDVLLEELGRDASIRGDLLEIKNAGLRAAELTRQLLAFSRQQVFEAKLIDVNELVHGMSKMFGRLLGEDLECRLSLASGLGSVRADPGQVEQVLMNLVVNARDAMPNGGKLLIETANVRLDEAYASERAEVRPGDYVLIAISDTGLGMDRATQARCFEPFFTTKERGKGTGLGLSTVFGIVKQSGGHVAVYSEPNHGTTFKVYLPIVEGELRPLAKQALPVALGRGTETILLVEDESAVRAVAAAILKRAGYRVLDVGTPTNGLTLCELYPEEIHLLLTDVVMPEMNGRELAARVRQRRANCKVLFMSGYTDNVILQHAVLEPGAAFLQKPLTPEALSKKVREVLDGP
ncbi:MAG: response regulator [Myxococcales bacterium]|nr:response regulator [Myxococcales bacterium]